MIILICFPKVQSGVYWLDLYLCPIMNSSIKQELTNIVLRAFCCCCFLKRHRGRLWANPVECNHSRRLHRCWMLVLGIQPIQRDPGSGEEADPDSQPANGACVSVLAQVFLAWEWGIWILWFCGRIYHKPGQKAVSVFKNPWLIWPLSCKSYLGKCYLAVKCDGHSVGWQLHISK